MKRETREMNAEQDGVAQAWLSQKDFELTRPMRISYSNTNYCIT